MTLSTHLAPFACLLALCWAVDARSAESDAQPNFALSSDGAYVIDIHAKLAWPRCAEGMRWDGRTCQGEPQRLTYAKATALARERRQAAGVPWRLPRLTELRRLVGRASNPTGLDAELFPGAPRDWHWSATANVDQSPVNQYNYGNVMKSRKPKSSSESALLTGWAVNLDTGESRGDMNRNTKMSVRLVMTIE